MEAKTLALYLGCDYYVFPDETITSGWLKVQLEHHPNLRYKYPLTLSNIQKVQEDGYKLLLRPLSSMNEYESILMQEHLGWIGASKDQVLRTFTDDLPEYFSTIIKASNWLRSKGFDCDDLIKNNEAIDSTKL